MNLMEIKLLMEMTLEVLGSNFTFRALRG